MANDTGLAGGTCTANDTGLAGGTRTENDTGLAGGTRTANDTGLAGGTRTENDTGLAGGTRTANDTGLAGGTRTANDTGLAGGTRTANNFGLENRQRAGNGKDQGARKRFGERKYLKEATVIVNTENVSGVRAEDIIKAISEQIGSGKVLAVRPRQGKEYELTLEQEEMCDVLIEGLTIKGVDCEVKKLQNKDYVVSFMHLPVYLDDNEILDKLEGWGVSPISKIKRRCYPGTDIEDGTRFVKVRFPKEVASLPYSTKLETAEGPQYFRVMHSHQVKTCRLCMSPGHLLKDCPEFKCYKCEERGHFARDCNAVRCPDCQEILNKCECWMEGEVGGREEQVDRQVHEGNNVEKGHCEERQEEDESQPKEAEEGTNNRQDGEGENEKDDEQIREEDMQLTPMDISSSHGQKGKEQDKETDSEGEIRMEADEKEKVERGQVRRRSLKVKPNLETARKKVLKKGLVKCLNSRFRLRPYHFENARSRLISEAKQGRAWLVLGWETAWEYQVLRFRLRPYHFENARSRLISEAKQGRAWLVLGWETAWEYQVLRFRLRPYHFENARSRLISEAKQGRAWLVLGWETAWEYQVLRFRLRPYHFENARSRLISEAKQGRAWLVLGWETAWEYQVLRFRLRPYHFENARSRLISEAKQGRAWLVLGWETAWEYQVL
ncbi:unnamed protein product [Leuciscus chuanchicus]